MAKELNIEDYQLVEVYEQGVWNTVWQKKESQPQWWLDYVEAKGGINKYR